MIRVRQVKVDVRNNDIIGSLIKKLRVKNDDILSFNIVKRSIDARHKDCVCFIYEVDVCLKNESKVKLGGDIIMSVNDAYSFIPCGDLLLNNRPVIVGSGPCGLFCAYELALAGFKPIVLERGEEIDKRVSSVYEFWNNNKLNVNSNVQFGEGGAGTFSDGKLSTQIKDKNNRISEVLRVFVENGAPEEIMYDFMPHIGTDRLRDVVKSMRNKIISLGGEFRFNSCLTNINISDNRISSIEINGSEIMNCDLLVLAIGHSARDTFYMLDRNGIVMNSKPFAVGFRVMHPQDLISKNQYGEFYKYLKPASYKLTYNTSSGRGVYSFCMCPGGYVVNASSFDGRLVVNGMSNYDRGSGVANSAIVVTVNGSDYGDGLFDGVKFQEKLERCAFNLGNGLIPVQNYKDYVNGCVSTDLVFEPKFMGGYSFSDLNGLFSKSINDSIKESFEYFDHKIPGFVNGILAGVESRTSSPIRIYRDEFLESNVLGIYPGGEGAGYAGGIVSAAVDGIKIYEKIVSKYNINY